ncbi:MAG: hypothetical protein FJ291_06550 [Planctomycetes bacterium]|nr:hypothetical protein [Planctomycetota bacterium]
MGDRHRNRTYKRQEERRQRGSYLLRGSEDHPVEVRSIILAHEIMHNLLGGIEGWWVFTPGEHVINPDEDDRRYDPYGQRWQDKDPQTGDWVNLPEGGDSIDQEDIHAVMHTHDGLLPSFDLSKVYISSKTQRILDVRANTGVER